ncbi:hypothetical protein BC830DRAFT_1144552 [Chytriomyces sp. MP71]|nr:hypothetical protein BC830DRAFT_1144552 [Chytriomyces sp. MP71]
MSLNMGCKNPVSAARSPPNDRVMAKAELCPRGREEKVVLAVMGEGEGPGDCGGLRQEEMAWLIISTHSSLVDMLLTSTTSRALGASHSSSNARSSYTPCKDSAMYEERYSSMEPSGFPGDMREINMWTDVDPRGHLHRPSLWAECRARAPRKGHSVDLVESVASRTGCGPRVRVWGL